MPASELLYFHNAPVAHIVAYQEAERANRLSQLARQFQRELGRRNGSR